MLLHGNKFFPELKKKKRFMLIDGKSVISIVEEEKGRQSRDFFLGYSSRDDSKHSVILGSITGVDTLARCSDITGTALEWYIAPAWNFAVVSLKSNTRRQTGPKLHNHILLYG